MATPLGSKRASVDRAVMEAVSGAADCSAFRRIPVASRRNHRAGNRIQASCTPSHDDGSPDDAAAVPAVGSAADGLAEVPVLADDLHRHHGRRFREFLG